MATLIKSDLEFVLQQILIAEQHAAGADLASILPNPFAMLGLRTVDGSFNNVVPGQETYGAADQDFPRLLDPFFRTADAGTYSQTNGIVVDSEPRTISNLIVDQTANNPAAVDAGGELVTSPGLDGIFGTADDTQVFLIPNTAPDEGLSAGFNSWFTFFGQFFDHGLDLVNKGGSGTVFIPLQPDDPLYDPDLDGADDILGNEDDPANFMVLTRATNDPGPDQILGTADDIHEHNNQTTPFVDQNQTYTSHPSHQVFLREYEVRDIPGDTIGARPVATGRLLDGQAGGLATWADVKANALLLGIKLGDTDALNVPLLLTDQYGNFIAGDNGFVQVVVRTGNGTDGIAGTDDDAHIFVEGTAAGLDINDPLAMGGVTVRTNHAFLDDIAHHATPVGDHDGNPITPPQALLADADPGTTDDGDPGTYDDELLNAHFATGDGRGNENIGLTAVHHVFHSEHNRQIDAIKATVLASGDPAFIAQWQLSDGSWNGERLFQAAKFATEMQYQHLVFEEFARKVQPNVDEFLMYDNTLDPAIVAEFAHVVYRFGHSMLTETVDRFDPAFNVIGNPNGADPAGQQMGLIAAFLNPLAFTQNGTLSADAAAGAIVRGMTRQAGNEIDEFVTEALRNNLVGLPLDLASINLARGRDAGVPSLNAARRDFFENTGDSQLKPYVSWTDFANNIKHAASAINFIAAYGTHDAITTATTLAEKRAAATLLVMGDGDDSDGVTINGTNYTDRLDFLNSTGAWANLAGGVTTTGVDDIDFWIGGLAEQQMPFGGMLGSTFNFVFETQLETLQNNDRFYYLGRLSGLNFLTEMENNSFAKLIMANTDVTRLPADVFSTPTWILEVDQSKQFNDTDGDGILDQSLDPAGGTELTPLVIRDNPATVGPDSNYLRYTGADHVVLGGTDPGNASNPSGNDILIASEGDDTVWGDGGNDVIEGGDGNDQLDGGDGDDIITDKGGDDVIKGAAGNDVIHAGNGLNLIIGGDGKDFIVTGEDVSEVFAGQGDDFIYGAKTNLPSLGNEGNDWIEIGTQDGAPGDNFDLLTRDDVPGHDVFIGGGGFDELLGEGGDDVMVGSEGEDHFDGNSGFDWATYKNDQLGVTVDLKVNDLVEPPATPSNAGILDRFTFVEGLSGSGAADVLRGDDQQAADILVAGFRGSVLTQEGIDLVTGLQDLLGADVTSFSRGNILLGGAGSDIVEGRAGDDIIDGDAWFNVRISVRENADGTGAEIRSADSMTELMQDMLAGTINPGQLVIQREILQSTTTDFDTAVFSGRLADYTISTADDGTTLVIDNRLVGPGVPLTDGTDILRNIERLQFADQAVVLPNAAGLNNAPVGQLTISDDTPSVNQVITVSNAGVTDADGIAAGSFTYLWQVERNPGSGVFEDIILDVGGSPSIAHDTSLLVTPDLDGLALRARAIYKDGDGTLENVYSAATAAVAGLVAVTAPPAPPAESPTVSAGNGVHFIRADLDFILDQIKIAEQHSDGANLTDILPNSRVPFGLRTVDGSFNNLIPGQEQFGAADESFPLLLDQVFRNEGDDAFGPVTNNNYATQTNVADADPRIISNLIVDQTANNFSAVAASGGGAPVVSPGPDGVFGTPDDKEVFFIGNATPDAALSAPFNAWFTFFGQFFDHGLDLVNKGGNGTIFIPLQPDDPLFSTEPGAANFMVVSRATNMAVAAGEDGLFDTADDVHFHNNQTTPFVDQNQTYTSHPAHQVFLREYALVDVPGDGLGPIPVDTGRLLEGANGGLATWADVKEQARTILGIELTDADIHNLPGIITDPYGNFIPGPGGFPQLALDNGTLEGDPTANGGLGVTIPANVGRTNHAFLDDIAHSANPRDQAGALLAADADADIGNPVIAGQYDDELLDAHYITGDGRGNENIGLTAVHFVFHAEHNRLIDHIKDVAIASNDVTFLNEWLTVDVGALPASEAEINALQWDGQRLFQAARFGTEMQYQHLVFEEFARKIQPQVDVFFAATQVYDTQINPAILAEFAHVVYRFGHSMLTETIDRYDPSFNVIDADPLHPDQDVSGNQIGLIAAFLNPLAFAASGATPTEAAGAIVRGVTRQAGNEIDEFVTEALRNNLVGLPLDLPAINIARGRDTGVPSLNQARAEFYAMTGDSQLKPYTSWADLEANIKHQESLVNFIAAYGTHESITAEATTAGKRAAAYAIVYGENGLDGIPDSGDEPTVPVPADRLEFLNAAAATSGVDAIDLWIGGLAEKQMPFGGLLGSTFNFVFETQMEMLQDGDRFYYLDRTASMNFLTELENNSFAKLIMANTDATHLPGDVFTTPAFTLEVDLSKQFTGLGAGSDDPEGVLRNDPNSTTPDPGYLQYTGDEHVVLGGTDPGNAANPSGNDTLIASIGDDTVYGDGGDDRLEGGFGNDFLLGGGGDDIITDTGGDDNFQGQDGNDAIHGGNGINLILGGFGNDFIVTGEDSSESFGGPGNDFILGGRANEVVRGNEGDDWIEGGMVDGEAGDNFDPFAQDLIRGNDVFIGDPVTDRMDGEGGDDIMLGNGGEGDRYEGFSGFDWAVFRDAPTGTTVDLTLRAFDETPVPLNEAFLARFTSVEGLSGSSHGDFLRGDNNTATEIAVSGAYGSVLENIGLIEGLQGFLDDMTPGAVPVASFGAGNIILGGAGSDLIEGRGGDDLIDGDLSLNVRLGVDENGNGVYDPGELSANSMEELQAQVFAGEINPGDIHIVREILVSPTADFDTAIFSGSLFDAEGDANYTIAVNGVEQDVASPITINAGDVVTVSDLRALDGTDNLRNIERLQFTDGAIVLNGSNQGPSGLLAISDATPAEDQALTVTSILEAGVTDPDNPDGGAITGPVTYYWQQEVAEGRFEDIVFIDEAPEMVRATGLTFTPGDGQVGLRLRVRAVYQDANGVLETVFSAATAAVANINDVPVGTISISDTTPLEAQALVALPQFTDADGIGVLSFQWQQANATGPGGGTSGFSNIAGATAAEFTPGQTQVNRELRVVVTYTDGNGTLETVISAVTAPTGDVINGTGGGNVLTGTESDDVINGNGGGDSINGLGGNDVLNGGAGADLINGGASDDTIAGGTGGDFLFGDAGNDTFNYVFGDGADIVDGGADLDTLNAVGTAGADTLNVVLTGAVLTSFEGGTLSGIEAVHADLLGGTDTLTYAGTSAASAVTVNLGLSTASGFASLAGIENVTGGSGADTLTGDAAANVLSGGAGNDRFVATAGDGDDTYNGGGNTDTYDLSGTTAGATVTNTSATSAETGTDTLSSIESFTGSQGNDTITVNGGVNVVDGQGGDDTINAGAGSDTVIGGAGNDTINYQMGQGADDVDGGADNDRLNVIVAAASTANDTLDVVFDGTAITQLEGGAVTGIEELTASLGGNGGAGDTLSYAGSSAAVTVDLTAQTGSGGFISLVGVENVTGGSGADTLTGVAGVNNRLTGGAGDDTFTVHDTGDVVSEAGGTGGGIDTVLSLANTFTIGDADVENLTFTGTGNFVGTGNGAANVITGGTGIDTLNGGGGADRLVETAGNVNDIFNGGAGSDTLDLSAATAATTVTSGFAAGADIGVNTLTSIENVIGGSGADNISMNGNNRIEGGGGDDLINTAVGNDTLVFAAGFDNDMVSGFDANGAGGQDLLNVAGLGITAATFADDVTIAVQGIDTVVSFAGTTDSITLFGINGVGANTITIDDFRFV